MRVAVIGAGPTGLLLGAALARRGHEVTLVDRDPGPTADGSWPRQGVMQFHHAHAFRQPLVEVLRAELPEAYDAWLALGAEPAVAVTPGGEVAVGVRSQRATFERVVRAAAEGTAGLTLVRGHVDGVVVSDGRAAGLRVGSTTVAADLVVDASGRSGRATDDLGERAGIGGPCGIAYVDRLYRLLPGQDAGPLVTPIVYGAYHDGYEVLVAPHEHGTFSVVLLRRTDDKDLARLRDTRLFDLAVAAIPALAAWAAPERAEPLTPVLAGGNLLNRYRAQTGEDGAPVLPGLVFVGDAVCTTTPNYARGLTTSYLQVAALLHLLDTLPVDEAQAAYAEWCEAEMRPWVEDHIAMDDDLARRWSGQDVDLDRPLPTDLVVAAAERDPSIAELAQPYLGMRAGPTALERARERARAVYATGWRPTYPDGPTRDELVALLGV